MSSCNICGGKEFSLGPNGRRAINGSLPHCVGCGSLERHRIVRSAWNAIPFELTIAKKALQFSSDPSVFVGRFGCFELSVYDSDNSLDLTNIDRADKSYDIVILNHVFEHVADDHIAFQEVHRIIADNGFCQFTVPDPINNPFTDDWGYPDDKNHGHYRIYGSDLIQRLCADSDIDVISLRLTDDVTENEDIVYFSSRFRQVLIDLKRHLSQALNKMVETSWINRSLHAVLRSNNNDTQTGTGFANSLGKHSSIETNFHEDGSQKAFSVIMPTFNRRHCIARAIDSVLAQDYDLYEIIVIDDGSSDGTADYLETRYPQQIMENRIIVIRQEHSGVSVARNNGLRKARYDWISYLDTDNQIKEGFLSTYRNFINQYPDRKCFYSKIIHKRSQSLVGRPFDFPELVTANYIDMNSFVHANMFPDEFFLFDPDLTRLVDYSFILKFCALYEPCFIDKILVCYDDSRSPDRITNSADWESNFSSVRDSEIKIKVGRLLKEFVSLQEFTRNAMQERDSALQERNAALRACDSALRERDSALQACDSALRERDSALQACDSALQERNAALRERDAIVASFYWRATEQVRVFVASKPKLRAVLKKILKPVFRLTD